MGFEVLNGFFKKINSFSKKTYSSVAQMAQETSNLFSYMAMVNMKLIALKRTMRYRITSTNKTFVSLIRYHLLIFRSSNAISSLYASVSLVLLEFGEFLWIFSSPDKPIMMAYLTFISSPRDHARVLVKKAIIFNFVACSTGLVFGIHN